MEKQGMLKGENRMARPTSVEPREGYRIWLRYSDGAAGEVDLSHYMRLTGKSVEEVMP